MFRSSSLRWHSALLYALLISCLMVGLFVYLSRQLGEGHVASLEARFEEQARAAASQPVLMTALAGDDAALQALLQEWASLLGAHVTLFDAAGHMRVDSTLDVESMDAEASSDDYLLPEVKQALAGDRGRSARTDPVTGERVVYLAYPILDNGQVVGALRWTYPLAWPESELVSIRSLLLGSLIVVTLAIITLLLLQSARSATTIRRLTTVADRISAGELDARVVSLSGGDVGQLTRAFNRMAGKLESQIVKRNREKDRLNTILHVMADGVVMVNRKGKVRLINPAAAHILQADADEALKRSFVQLVRDHRIAAVWERCKESGLQEASGIELRDDRYVRVVVTPYLRGRARGYLIMLQDLSRMRQLQTVRQDFVSNVSHDLRTPLAALRALVETLRDGALDDPPAAQHFLDRMEGEVDSLTQLVEELLTLSRIESGQAPLQLEPMQAAEIIRSGVERLRPQAERLNIDLIVDLPEHLPDVMVDGSRVRQVVANLVHNAIKFTSAGGTITVSAEPVDEVVTVIVQDSGVGIAAGDLPRIFERFYKSDRSRSGNGTGLGLAIAKHVILAHDGDIWAESVEGEGSTFYFTLPIADPNGFLLAAKTKSDGPNGSDLLADDERATAVEQHGSPLPIH